MEYRRRENWSEDDWAALKQVLDGQQKDMTISDVMNYYGHVGENDLYEKTATPERYNGPKYAAKAVAEFFTTDREKVKILDIAAGTGLLGEKLQQYGFQHIDALEPSREMAQKAREKRVYEKYFTEILDGKKLPIADDTYDCSVICAGLAEGHIPCSGFKELIRITKPGGLICNVMSVKNLTEVEEYTRLEPLMKNYEEEKKWIRLSRDLFQNYFLDWEDTYDCSCSVICGGLAEGHIPCSGFKELIRITKPGALICNVMSVKNLTEVEEYTRLEPLMKNYEEKKKWIRLSRDLFQNYFLDWEGVIHKFKVL